MQPFCHPARAGTGPTQALLPCSFGQHPCCGFIYGVSLVPSALPLPRLSACCCDPWTSLASLPVCTDPAPLTPAFRVLLLPPHITAPVQALCQHHVTFAVQRGSSLNFGDVGALSEVLCTDRLFPRSTRNVSPSVHQGDSLALGKAALELEEQDLCEHSN